MVSITSPVILLWDIKIAKIDVVISDIEMLEMNGVDFVKMIKENSSILINNPKIIILTSTEKLIFKKLLSLKLMLF